MLQSLKKILGTLQTLQRFKFAYIPLSYKQLQLFDFLILQ